jgi:hypothetical protein
MSNRSRQEPEIVEAEVIGYDPVADPTQSLASSSLPCGACGTPRQIGSRFCVACGIPFETPNEFASGSLTPPKQSPSSAGHVPSPKMDSDPDGTSCTFKCQSCGSEIDAVREQRSLRCPFCDSTYVVELPADQRTSQNPEFIIGFEVTREQAQEMFFEWIGKNSFFRPGDLTRKAMTDKQNGVYVPFWHFSMKAVSQWSAQIGEYWYRTETYTVKDSDGKTRVMTRTVQETEWWPLSGIYRKYYSGYMVSASKGLPQKEALAIQPFKLSTMVRYRPLYLAGWMSEEYSIDRESALAVTQEEFRNRERAAISGFLPGDTHSGLNVTTSLDVGGSDLVLLPVHVLSYRYKDRVFRFLVNGQTGKTYGEKPWSSARITAVVVGVALLIMVVIGLVIVLNHPRLN